MPFIAAVDVIILTTDPMVATPVELLLHVPPIVSISDNDVPLHTELPPMIGHGAGRTVMVLTPVQPAVEVNVIVAAPVALPVVISPLVEPIVATVGSLLLHTPEPDVV